MVERGWVEEVGALLRRGLGPDLPPFQAIGYRQIARHVAGEWTLERAIEETIRATRRFAKRQWTWFRKEPAVTWFDATDLDGANHPKFRTTWSVAVWGGSMPKHSINIQDGFLFQNLKEGQTMDFELVTGRTIAGRLKRFDRFAVVLEVEGAEILLYKHAIATIAKAAGSGG